MEDDVERFTRESAKSFSQVKIKNQRERVIHKSKANNLDNEAKMARWKMEKAQRDMVAHLQQLKTDQMVCGLTDLKEPDENLSGSEEEEEDEDRFINPFPITFKKAKEPETDFEKMGKRYAARRGRRMSKEFEDLDVHTSTGQLLLPDLRSRGSSRLLLPPITGLDGRNRNRSASSSNLSASLRQLNTLGQPEFIKSVRRSRKSVDQQHDQIDHLRAFGQMQSSRARTLERSDSSLSTRSRVPSAGSIRSSLKSRPDSALSTRSSIDSPMLIRRKSPMMNLDIGNLPKRQDSFTGDMTPKSPMSPSLAHLASPMISRKQFRQRKLSTSSNKCDISPREELMSPPPAKLISPRTPSPPSKENGVIINVIASETDANDNNEKSAEKPFSVTRKISTTEVLAK